LHKIAKVRQTVAACMYLATSVIFADCRDQRSTTLSTQPTTMAAAAAAFQTNMLIDLSAPSDIIKPVCLHDVNQSIHSPAGDEKQ